MQRLGSTAPPPRSAPAAKNWPLHGVSWSPADPPRRTGVGVQDVSDTRRSWVIGIVTAGQHTEAERHNSNGSTNRWEQPRRGRRLGATCRWRPIMMRSPSATHANTWVLDAANW